MPQSGRVRRRWLVKFVNRSGSATLGWRIVVAAIALAALRSPAAGEPVGVDLQLVIAIDCLSVHGRKQAASSKGGLRSRDSQRRGSRSHQVRASRTHRDRLFRMGESRLSARHSALDNRRDGRACGCRRPCDRAEPLAAEGGTSISAALLFSERLLHAAGVRADRKIIDVSGDGRNNSGPLLSPARHSVLASGVTVNGLAIALLTKEERTFGPFAPTTIRSYYQDCVIGGAGAFVIEVAEVGDFEPAIRTKLTREIARMHPLTQRVAYVSKHSACDRLREGQSSTSLRRAVARVRSPPIVDITANLGKDCQFHFPLSEWAVADRSRPEPEPGRPADRRLARGRLRRSRLVTPDVRRA